MPKIAVSISIHAPPRGATHWRAERKAPCRSFQFTPLREGRRGSVSLIGQPNSFQFTPLREGRRSLLFIAQAPMYFNSRPSARGDDFTEKGIVILMISIHAPPRGAT